MNDRYQGTFRRVGVILCGGCLLLGLDLRADQAPRGIGISHGRHDVIAEGISPTAAQLGAAAKAYGCSEEEAGAMLQRVRPELRGAFLAGKMSVARKMPQAEAAIKAPAGDAARARSREEIIQTMGEINQWASDENWPAARAGAMRREYARRLGTNAVSLAELKALIGDASTMPVMPATNK